MASLFNINKEYLELCELIESGEVDDDVIRDTMESIEGEFEDKADSIAYLIAEIEGRIAVRDKEISRLDGLNVTDEHLIEKLKGMLFNAMELRGKQKFKTASHNFGIVNNGGVRPLVYAGGGAPKGEQIPEAFRKVKTEISVDTEAVRNILDKGLDLEWVHYGERGRSLRIK